MYSHILKELRLENSLTQNDIEKILSIPQSTYNRWELGLTQPKVDDIIKLCKFFNVSADYLLGLSDY